MYSIVLAMALTGGGDVPAGLFNHGCCGGGGHHTSCYGGSCYGGSCYGGHKHHGHGCSGSCYGSMNYGCCGGHGHKHHRGHGCCGGCYGGYAYGGCYGSGYGSGYGYGGCYGGVGGMGGVIGAPMGTGVIVPNTGTAPVNPAVKPSKNQTNLDNAAPATLIVRVPADARLTIDGEATTSTTAQRVFVSPALSFGHEYHYTLQAEFTKDGKVVKVSKQVSVKAGDETRVNFDAESVADVASR